MSSLTVHFQTFRVKSRDYRSYQNPPILHRKETFLAPDHPSFEKFARSLAGLKTEKSDAQAASGWLGRLTGRK